MDRDDAVVRTAIRIRPKPSECTNDIQQTTIADNTVLDLISGKAFAFDRVFDENHNQSVVYEQLIKPQVEKFVEGYSGVALAYGQTGTGKTYSMGLHNQDSKHSDTAGIVYRALVDIFDLLKKKYGEENSQVRISYLEVYNEKIHDLLDEYGSKILQKNALRGDVNRKPINSVDEALKLLEIGSEARHVRPTKLNTVSSRSHAVVTIHATFIKDDQTLSSGLCLVDLAGSEGAKRTGNEGLALAEGNYINQGLLAVGKVLQALSSKSKVIPYRDSVLTQLLQDALNTNSYVTLLGCINLQEYQGSMSTLRFAQNAKQIKINPQVNGYLKEMCRAKTPFKTPLQANTNRTDAGRMFYPPLSTVKRPESRHTICTPRKKTKLEFVKPLNSTTVEEPKIPDVVEFFHPNNFQEALEMIRDVPQPAEENRDSIPSTMSVLNVSSSTAKDPVEATQCSYSCRSQTVSPIMKRIENLEALLESKFQQLYDTFACNQSVTRSAEATETLLVSNVIQNFHQVVRDELDDIKNISRNTTIDHTINLDESEIPLNCPVFKQPASASCPKKLAPTRRSTRLLMKKNNSPQKVNKVRQSVTVLNTQPTIKKISKKTHKANVLNLLKTGTMKELQMLGTIGPKTAYQILSFRNIQGSILDWDAVEQLPIWKGNGFTRFKMANMID